MIHLRRRSKPVLHGLICAITDRSSEANHPYVRAMIEGAPQQADNRGYTFSLFILRRMRITAAVFAACSGRGGRRG